MSKLIPSQTIDVYRTFNDMIIGLIGIPCTLYMPNNLTQQEPNDMYTAPGDVTYTKYDNQDVWITWFVKDLHRLRKLGVFAEDETPILARFKNTPEIIINSYITVPVRYIPNTIDTDEFEIVDVMTSNMYDSEIYRWFKIAPRRAK